MTEFNDAEQRQVNEAKKLEEQAKRLRKKAAESRRERESYAVRSKILGTPEWEREKLLEQERKVQADAARVSMFKDGVEKFIRDAEKNASLYEMRLQSFKLTHNEYNNTVQIVFNFLMR